MCRQAGGSYRQAVAGRHYTTADLHSLPAQPYGKAGVEVGGGVRSPDRPGVFRRPIPILPGWAWRWEKGAMVVCGSITVNTPPDHQFNSPFRQWGIYLQGEGFGGKGSGGVPALQVR